MQQTIKKLSDLRGISGHEYRINKQISEMFKPYSDSVRLDALGSVIAVKKCKKPNAPKIMLEAHMDEIGLIVKSITDEGYIRFSNVGGVDPRILPSSEVVIHGETDIDGIVGIPPKASGDTQKSYKLTDLLIDTGLSSEEVRSMISVGDSITLPQSVGELCDGQFSSKTMDDRASVAAILKVMQDIRGADLNCDVYAVCAVQEEVGCRGGKTTSYGIMPDMAIAIDVTHGITPDNSENAVAVGNGTAMSKGPNIHPKLVERLERTAIENSIGYAVEIDGGATGTDAWEIQVSGGGIPVALMSIPLKYMHTSVETLAISDVTDTARVITEFIKGLEGDTSWLCLWND